MKFFSWIKKAVLKEREDLLELFKDESDIKYGFRAALGPDIYEPNLKRSAITREYLKKFNERLISKE
jgi:hypothetical protein